jgi:hypothetical protein
MHATETSLLKSLDATTAHALERQHIFLSGGMVEVERGHPLAIRRG